MSDEFNSARSIKGYITRNSGTLTIHTGTSLKSDLHYSRMKKAIDHFVNTTLAKGIDGLRQEFVQLQKTKKPDFSEYRAWAQHPSCNRYTGIYCIDKTRIVIEGHPDKMDYINANYVSSPLSEKRWICTQAPLPNTVYDFWLMVFEQKAIVILQLCQFIENNQEKCAMYYPKNEGEEVFYKDIRIKCVTVELLGTPGKVVQRIFNVHKRNNGKDIYHLAVGNWPDHGVPEPDVTLLKVLQKVRICLNSPIIVHCSAGIGRTGTIVAIENILESFLQGRKTNVYDTVVKIRQERVQSVQKESQYFLITRLILEYLIRLNQIPKTPSIEFFFQKYEQVTADPESH